MTRLLLLLVTLCLAGCAADPSGRRADGTCPLIPLAQMPLEVRSNLLFVQAKINDETVRMLVDSGAERTLLTEAAVDRLHLPPRKPSWASPCPQRGGYAGISHPAHTVPRRPAVRRT